MTTYALWIAETVLMAGKVFFMSFALKSGKELEQLIPRSFRTIHLNHLALDLEFFLSNFIFLEVVIWII